MRDPAYYVLIAIVIILALDHFLFHGMMLNFIGRNMNNMAMWIAGWMGG